MLAACSGGAGEGPRETRPATAVDEAAAVESAVRSYLEAVANDDPGGKIAHSTGELVDLAAWQQMVSLSFGSAPGNLEVEALSVARMEGDRATLDLSAELRLSGFLDDPPFVFSGPVEALREPDGWKVADYLRDGRSQRAATFTEIEGTGEADGVTVELNGVALQEREILAVIEVRNATTEPFSLLPSTIVAEDGRRLEFGEPSATQRAVLPSGPLETYLYWSGRSLPLTTDGFELVAEFVGTDSDRPVAVHVPVELLD